MIGTKLIAGGAFALGVLSSGIVGGAAYWVTNAQLTLEKAKTARISAEITANKITAKAEADAAQLMIDALYTDLAHSWKMRRIEVVTVEKEIERVSSPTHLAARSEPVRLFNSAQATAAVRRHRASIAAGAVPTLAAHPNGSASERGVMTWAWGANASYEDVAEAHSTLAEMIKRAPCFKVVNR